jgi:hypothetical protein
MGIASRVVTLSDLGVSWNHQGETRFGRIPGIASLIAVRPQFFKDRGDTKVDYLLACIASDTSL